MEPVDGGVGRKRRRDDSSWNLLLSLPEDGILRCIWRACVASPAQSLLHLITEAIPVAKRWRKSFLLTDFHKTVLCLVFQRMDIHDVLRCSMTCRTLKSVIQSEEFRSCFRSATHFTAPIVAVIAHPYARIVPAAIPPQSPYQNTQLSLDFADADNFPFIADVRDGFVLLYNLTAVEYQRFILINPITHVTEEIPRLKHHNPLPIYIAAGFIPCPDTFDYEIIILYAHGSGNCRQMSTALFYSKTGLWETTLHTLELSAPRSRHEVRIPSMLINRTWSILIKESCVLTTEMIPAPFDLHQRSEPRATVRMSVIPLPTPLVGELKCMVSNYLLGKDGKDLCFILLEPGGDGLQIWRCNLSSPLPHVFSTATHYPLGLNGPIPTLLGFAEENRIAMLQPEFLVPDQMLFENILR
ncbi:hypothetical protein ACQ4PT_056169 [Festuca glaucescens]